MQASHRFTSSLLVVVFSLGAGPSDRPPVERILDGIDRK